MPFCSLFARGPSSATTVVLLVTTLLQGTISYTLTVGRLADLGLDLGMLRLFTIALRVGIAGLLIVLWLLDRHRALFPAIITATVVLTIALIASVVGLLAVLFRLSPGTAVTFAADVVLMAVTNVLIFSIWYWIIDPPGIDDTKPADQAWDFLFPQRSGISGYESWVPAYTDYLFVAFNTSLAFSPTDTLPLRAKGRMMLQAAISVVTIVVIASTAINAL